MMEATAAADIQIPYFVSKRELPAELPSKDTIELATSVLSDSTGVRIVEIGPHFVVKFGCQVSIEEGRVMVFLQQTTSIKVPKVYALEVADGKTFIIMENINGSSLDKVWSSLSDAKKKAIALQLGKLFIELRSLPSDKYCSVGQRPLQDRIFYSGIPDVHLGGPFDTESQLNDAMIQKFRLSG